MCPLHHCLLFIHGRPHEKRAARNDQFIEHLFHVYGLNFARRHEARLRQAMGLYQIFHAQRGCSGLGCGTVRTDR